jgi:GNAT superfamily N-acetyltransferase
MEIRTLEAEEQPALLALLEDHPPVDGQPAHTLLARRVEHDPTWSPDQVIVAVDHGRLLGCIVTVPRPLLVLGHRIPCAGLALLFIEPGSRKQGFAKALVEHAAVVMRERGVEISIVFPAIPELFEAQGWRVWAGQRAILRRSEKGVAPAGAVAPNDDVELDAFDPESDRGLSAIQAIHSAYAANRHGSVIRDEALWKASFALAGNPQEEIWIARRGGLAVAYARAAMLDEVLTVTEMGRFEDGASALAKLVRSLLEPRGDDPLATGGRSSEAVRDFLVLPTFDDIGLTVALEHEGTSSHPMEERRGLIRCLNLNALAARLDVELFEGETPEAFLERILPPDGFVFWPADRF